MLAVLAPGQGAQKPGFLTPWLSEWEGAAEAVARLDALSEAAGLDLAHLGTAADADEIRDTAKTQPLLVAAGLLTAGFLPLERAGVTAGHSVGELTAAAITGVLTDAEAVALAATRGREMAAACALETTGMSAVMGEDDVILPRLSELDLTPANRNGASQTVAAGSMAALEALSAEPIPGVKVIRLQVAGAFHTHYMAPAEKALAAAAAGLTPHDPSGKLLSNADGAVVASGTEMLQRLIAQVTSPVRWDLCQATFAELGVTAVLELAPAGTLTGLARRTLKGVERVNVNTPADLDAARALIEAHA